MGVDQTVQGWGRGWGGKRQRSREKILRGQGHVRQRTGGQVQGVTGGHMGEGLWGDADKAGGQ